MKRYTINADYTGAFDLPFPFEFDMLSEAEECCAALNVMRMTLPSWNILKEFKIYDRRKQRWAQ